MYCTHTNDEFIEYAALTIQAHTNDQPNCRRYAVSDRSILLEVETDLTGAHCGYTQPAARCGYLGAHTHYEDARAQLMAIARHC